MNAVPSSVVAGALAIGLLFPFLQLVLPRAFRGKLGFGSAFRLNAAIAAASLASWCALADSPDPTEIVAAALLLVATLIGWFIIFSLLAWGLTLTMLTTLATVSTPLNVRDWMVAYSNGAAPEILMQNRLSILLKTGLVTVETDGLRLTMPGRIGAKAVNLLRKYVGSD